MKSQSQQGDGSVVIPQPEPTVEPTPEPTAIPDWIRNNAGWWAEGLIGDNDFVQGIQYLINQNIIKIPPTSSSSGSGDQVIPDWIKNNAGWWAEGLIGDNDFVQGIQFLVENGIIRVS